MRNLDLETFPVSVKFQILRPCPTNGYCYTQGTCGGTPCTVDQTTCSGTIFCPKNKACGSPSSSSCSADSNRYTTSKDYQIAQSINIPLIPGRQVYTVDPTVNPLYVKKGYVIGYTSGPGLIVNRGLLANEASDLLATTACSSSCTGTVTNTRHFLRAIAAKPSNILFFHTYTIPNM